jgi:MFS family permease
MAEQWFLRRGLPSIVRGRPSQLLVRIVPALVTLIAFGVVLDVLSAIDGQSEEDFDRLMGNAWFAWAYTLLLLGLIVVPVIGGWLAARWARGRFVELGGTAVAVAAAVVFVLMMPVADALLDSYDHLVLDVLFRLMLVGVLLVLAFFGGGAVLGWALRAALRQTRSVRALTGRALPLLLLFSVFGFLTDEIWKMSASLNRSQMWAVVGLFALVGVLFLVSRVPEEMRSAFERQSAGNGLRLLATTPFAALDAGEVRPVPLRKAERLNVGLVLALTQALQAVVVATLMFAFFVVFGWIAVDRALMKTWSGHPLTAGKLFGLQIPVPNELLQVSLFIAAFSGLYFVASMATDALYRSAFVDPLADHMAESLSARDVYLARWGNAE